MSSSIENANTLTELGRKLAVLAFIRELGPFAKKIDENKKEKKELKNEENELNREEDELKKKSDQLDWETKPEDEKWKEICNLLCKVREFKLKKNELKRKINAHKRNTDSLVSQFSVILPEYDIKKENENLEREEKKLERVEEELKRDVQELKSVEDNCEDFLSKREDFFRKTVCHKFEKDEFQWKSYECKHKTDGLRIAHNELNKAYVALRREKDELKSQFYNNFTFDEDGFKEFQRKVNEFTRGEDEFLWKLYDIKRKPSEFEIHDYDALKTKIKDMVIEEISTNNAVHTCRFNDNFLVEINEGLVIHPLKFYDINSCHRQHIINATNETSDNELFEKDFRDICEKYRIKFERQREEGIRTFCNAFCVQDLKDIKIGENAIFEYVQPHHIDRLTDLMNKTVKKDHQQDLIEIASKLAVSLTCNKPQDYFSYLEFVCKYLENQREALQIRYRKYMKQAKINQKPGERSNADYEIPKTGTLKEFFYKKVVEEINENVSDMQRCFCEIEKLVRKLNDNASFKFLETNEAVYHYYKHKNWKVNDNDPTVKRLTVKELTVNEYFDIACEVAGNLDIESKSIMNQEANCTFITRIDRAKGAVCILIELGSKSEPERFIASLFQNLSKKIETKV